MSYGYNPSDFGRLKVAILQSSAEKIGQDAQRIGSSVGNIVTSVARAKQNDEMLYNQAYELRNSYVNGVELLAKYNPEVANKLSAAGVSSPVEVVPPPNKDASTTDLINYINVLTPKVNSVWSVLAYSPNVPTEEIAKAMHVPGLTEDTRKIIASSADEAFKRLKTQKAASDYSNLLGGGTETENPGKITLSPPSADGGTQATTQQEKKQPASISERAVAMGKLGYLPSEYEPYQRAELESEKLRAGLERSAEVTRRDAMLEEGRMKRALLQHDIAQQRIANYRKQIESMTTNELNKAAIDWSKRIKELQDEIEFSKMTNKPISEETLQNLQTATELYDITVRMLESKRRKAAAEEGIKSGTSKQTIQFGEVPMTEDDWKALAYVMANKDDPRSEAILQKLRKERKIK